MSVALVPGSFDPFHSGHLAVVEWAAARWDEVVVAVLGNPEKPAGLFTVAERVRLAAMATAHLPGVRCLSYAGITGQLAREQDAEVIVRSGHKEPDEERSLAVLNRFLSDGVPTRFTPEDAATAAISSTLVRDLLVAGDVSGAQALVPEAMREALATAERVPGPRPPRPVAGTGPMTLGRRVDPLRVAAVQAAPVPFDRDGSLERALDLVKEAGTGGAGLVLFPEAYIPGYPDWVWGTVPSGDQARSCYGRLFDNSVVVGSAATQVLALAAQRYRLYLSIGIHEREAAGSTLYSTQLLFSPDGAVVSVHRKLVATGPERLLWGAGDGTGLAVVETPFGRIGTLSGWENYMPLARAALYAQGADIHLAPAGGVPEVWPATVRHVAREGGVFVVAASSPRLDAPSPEPDGASTTCAGEVSEGGTMVVGPDGTVLSGPTSGPEGMVTAEIDVNAARHRRQEFDPMGRAGRPDVLSLRVRLGGQSAASLESGPASEEDSPAPGGSRSGS